MINYTYGILTGGVTPDLEGYRYTDSRRTKAQEDMLHSLVDSTDPERGIKAHLLLGLLQCSENWPGYLLKFDSQNTYMHTPTTTAPMRCSSLGYSELLNWNSQVDITSSKYPVYPQDSFIHQVTNKLFSILTYGNL